MLSFSVRKFILLPITVLLLIGLGVIGWVEYQLRTVRATFTEVVDHTKFDLPGDAFAIKNVSVLSPDCRSMTDSQTVVIANGKIAAVGKNIEVPADYEVKDGSGKYLIPGLHDSHIHLRANPNDLLLYLANGVTSIREMSGNSTYLSWRNGALADFPLPHMFISSKKITSKTGIAGLMERWTYNKVNYGDYDKAFSVIRGLKAEGYDALKISNVISKEMYETTLEIAKKEGIRVIGHVPNAVSIEEVIGGGQEEIAHIEEITKSLINEFGGLNGENTTEFMEFIQERGPGIAQKLKENNIAVASTIWLMESLPRQKFDLKNILKEINLEYANPALVEGTKLTRGWLPGHNAYQLSKDTEANPEAKKRARKFWNAYVKAIHTCLPILLAEDVQILAGTDANATIVVPGFSLHDELESLVDAGMSSAEALYSATTAPAQWTSNNTGQIKPGYEADLILLNRNPLENISYTRSIETVVSKGRVLNTTTISKMLQEVANCNARSRNTDINPFKE